MTVLIGRVRGKLETIKLRDWLAMFSPLFTRNERFLSFTHPHSSLPFPVFSFPWFLSYFPLFISQFPFLIDRDKKWIYFVLGITFYNWQIIRSYWPYILSISILCKGKTPRFWRVWMRITKTTFLMIFLSIIVINFSTMMSPVGVKSGKNYLLIIEN